MHKVDVSRSFAMLRMTVVLVRIALSRYAFGITFNTAS